MNQEPGSSDVPTGADINLNPNAQVDVEQIAQAPPKGRRVRRVIHCSDGVYEEYSSDEEGVYQIPQSSSLVDPKTMPWSPWIAHVSSKALAACDYVGETLADFLGITGPKYRYEIEEAHRMKEQEEEEKKAADLEMAGWRSPGHMSDNDASSSVTQTSTPVSILPTSAQH